MTASFSGFPQEGLSFLTELGTKDKAFLDANRKVYEGAVVAPAKAFVVAIGEALQDTFAPQIVAVPKTNGSMSPINNDLRFNPNATPYKDHLLLKFWEGPSKKTAPTLWLRISEADIGFASGAALPDLDRWRGLIDDESTGADLAAALTVLGKRRKLDIAGQAYKKVPKPYSEDHPRADLLKHKMFQARWPEPTPKAATSAKLVDHCMKRLTAAADVHRWLVTHL